jgi:hypothetical protein
VLTLILLTFLQTGPTVSELNKLASAVDVKQLAKFSTGDGSEFRVLKGGAYDVGSKGWTVQAVKPSFGGEFVVFSTPLTSQDTGELVFVREGSKLKYIDERTKDGLRLNHHQLAVEFNFPAKSASFTDKVQVIATENSSLRGHIIRFSPCYKVSKITNEVGNPISFTQVSGVVLIAALTPGKHELNFTYSGVVNLPDYAGSITPENATLTNDYWYPMVNRMPATYDISVRGPADFTTIGQGKLVGEQVQNGEKITSYKMDLPVIYWSLTCAKMSKVSEKFGNRTIHMWSPRVSKERMALQPKLYEPILKLYETKFAPFPFDSYGALDSPTYGGGALEAYSFATYGGGLPAEDGHETGHTWFGGIINNSYLTSFWNESFAVWVDGFYNREVPIGAALERREAFQTISMPSEAYNKATLMRSGADIGPIASSLGYGKGALVLSMLEQLVGTDNLTESIREWLKVHPKGEPGEWEDFEKVVLRLMPQFKLQAFFDDWFRRPGFASFELNSCALAANIFSGKIKWNSVPFRMPIEIWTQDAAGRLQKNQIDTNSLGPDGSFSIKMVGFKPVKAFLDPYHKALRTGAAPKQERIDTLFLRETVYRDSETPDYMRTQEGEDFSKNLPTNLNRVTIIGHPDSTPRMRELCKKVGFGVNGDLLNYNGTTIDLRKAGALAVVSLDGGGRCVIALGKCQMTPNTGQAKLALVDNLGRILRAKIAFPDENPIPIN